LKKLRIKAVEMVRHIREEQAQKLKGKSKAEIIAFFRKAGEAAQKAKQNRAPQ
jgi:hypothetical protein